MKYSYILYCAIALKCLLNTRNTNSIYASLMYGIIKILHKETFLITAGVHGETDVRSNVTDQMLPGEYNAEMMYYAMATGKLLELKTTFGLGNLVEEPDYYSFVTVQCTYEGQ